MTPQREAAIQKHMSVVIEWAGDARDHEVARYIRATNSERREYGQEIRRMRKARGLRTQRALAVMAGVNVETVSRIENGANVEVQTLAKIVDALMTDLDYPPYAAWRANREEFLRRIDALAFEDSNRHLLSSTIDGYSSDERADVSNYKRNDIPVIAEGDASPSGVFWDEDGKPIIHIDEWMSRPDDKAVRDPSCYAIVIRGDSMEPMIRRGMRAIISPNIPVGEGDLAYVHLKSGERLVKMVHKHPNGWLLESFNREYPPRFVDNAEVSALHRVAYVRTLK